MDNQAFFREGRWLTSFASFSNSHLLYHIPSQHAGQSATINARTFNRDYPNIKRLSELMAQQTYQLSRESRNGQYSLFQSRIYYLKKILKHIVAEADEQGLTVYHKITYLVLKYLVFMISQQALRKGISLEHQVSIYQWLSEVHALFYETNIQTPLYDLSTDEKLMQTLIKGDYEALTDKLRELLFNEPDRNKNKINFILTLLLAKQNKFQARPANEVVSPEQLSKINQNLMTAMQQKKRHIFRVEKEKKKKNASEEMPFEDLLAEVLLGNANCIQKISQKSWPLYLLHRIFSSATHTVDEVNYKEEAIQFITKTYGHSQSLPKEEELLLGLLGADSFHKTYQLLLNFCPPYLSHLIAYFYSLCHEGFVLPAILGEEYFQNIVRNLIYNASQISYSCLLATYAAIDMDQAIQSRREIIEPLLYHHLHVSDCSNASQVQGFLKKIEMLIEFQLTPFGQTHIQTLFSKMRKAKLMNCQIVQTYLLCAVCFGKGQQYDQLMINHITNCYATQTIGNLHFLTEIDDLRKHLSSKKRYKNKLKQFDKIDQTLDRYRGLSEILNQPDFHRQMRNVSIFLPTILQSLQLLLLCEQFLKRLSAMEPLQSIQKNQSWQQAQLFIDTVARFIHYYPKNRTEPETACLARIVSMIV